eukprot:1148331-Pelagomonas_calceolata.AAC.1
MVIALPTLILSIIWVRSVKNVSTCAADEAALEPCIARTYRVKTSANGHNPTNRLHAFIWLVKTYAIPAGMQARWDMGHTLLTLGHRNGQPVAEVDSERFAEPSWGENH